MPPIPPDNYFSHEHLYRLFRATGGALCISVAIEKGTSVTEFAMRLSPKEIGSLDSFGRSFLDSLANQIRRNRQAFASRLGSPDAIKKT